MALLRTRMGATGNRDPVPLLGPGSEAAVLFRGNRRVPPLGSAAAPGHFTAQADPGRDKHQSLKPEHMRLQWLLSSLSERPRSSEPGGRGFPGGGGPTFTHRQLQGPSWR